MYANNKIVGLLIAMVLAAFALPASADKVYQLTMSSTPAPLAAGVAGQSVSMQINNISNDTGNSNSSSFKLKAPLGFTIQQIYTVSKGQTKNTVAVGGGYTATVQVLSDGTAVWVSNIQVPLKPFGPPLQLNNMTVDVSCSADTSGAWVLPGVWTGSGFSGQTFTLNTTQYPNFPSTTKTPVSGICTNYTISPLPTTANVNAGGGSVSLSFNNTSPVGGGSIGSLSINAPTNFTITGGTAPTGWTVTPINSGAGVKVTGGPAVGPTSSLTVNLTVTTPNCNGADPVGWSSAKVYTGSNLDGAQFSPASPPSSFYPKTGITALACSATFVNQPATTFVGYVITNSPYNYPTATNPLGGDPVTVTLVINGFPAPDNTLVTLSSACSISNYTASTSGGVATFASLTGGAPATDCTLSASGGGVNSTQPSSSFDLVGPAGTLACATGSASSNTVTPPLDPTSSTPPPSDGQTGWALVRGNNTDGHCGDPIPYSFSCDPDTSTCQFTEDSLGQHPSIEYVILWPKVDVLLDPTADKQPCVAWGIEPPLAGADSGVCDGDYVPGLACTTDNVNGGDAVMPTIPSIPGYNDKDPGLYPQYQPGQKAKVCIAQHGFTSGTATPDAVPPRSAVGFEVYWTKVIDQSDSTVKLP